MIPGMNGGEFLVIALLAALLLGPERLPDLARQAGRLVRRGRDFAVGARDQMKDEMGVDLDGVDWRRYDPRQYHPRRIVQNALSDAFEDEPAPRYGSSAVGSDAARAAAARPTPAPGAALAAKRAEASRPLRTTPGAPGPGSASRDVARGPSSATPRRPSPPPTSWAEAARRVGVDDDAT